MSPGHLNLNVKETYNPAPKGGVKHLFTLRCDVSTSSIKQIP